MNRRSLIASLCTTLALVGCGGGAGDSAALPADGTGTGGASSTMGTLQVSLTDAPACGYEAVYVTVVGVRVHKSEAAGDGDGGWVDLPLPTPYTTSGLRINLLDLTNGVLQGLGRVVLPAGQYTQMRLILADNAGSSAPFANSVLPVGGVETELSTPSAQKSGLKIKINAEVPAGQVAHVVIDFDACKSVVKRGHSGKGYNLKPVLNAMLLPSELAGMRVVGWVSPLLSNGYTRVSLQFGGRPVKATVPDPTSGRFELFPVPVGQYDLVVTAPGHATAVMTGVPVMANADTAVNTPGQRIDAPSSDMRAVRGTVSPVTADVRALQTLDRRDRPSKRPGAQSTATPGRSRSRCRSARRCVRPTRRSTRCWRCRRCRRWSSCPTSPGWACTRSRRNRGPRPSGRTSTSSSRCRRKSFRH